MTAKMIFSEELWKVSRKMRTLFDARVRAEGLTLPRARALILLAKKDCVNQTELAEALEIEGPTLVPLLDGLERQGLIVRKPVDGDRRAKQVALTAAGQEQASHVNGLVKDFRSDVLKDVSEDDLKAAIRVFHAIARNMEAAC
ncbi:MarR family winged helix-turn-helix transcriptional regulator [Microvirga guangxiensis]|uniref:DNA-binding transcriptional regulator, MarR family n=1 Tax=Microvirga guangxiensis TaxID=549386 RepID=A0A1G5BDG5_9HYPH|nr:MarR family transcriptional regulator [Microvirga guangxiensis]SCX88154.1 DNA-binding transcriptional regulator, MarR family [Microvirga guangxiensis]